MKRIYKFILIFVLHIFATLVAPLLATGLAPADSGMAICMLLFFIGYPICIMALGVFATTDIKALIWAPLACAVTFPLLFSIAMGGMVWELYYYSVIYLILSYVTFALVLIIKKIISKGKNKRNEGI